MTSNPTQQTPDHQPGGPRLAWRGAPQPPWPGPQPPWPAPARPDPPADPPSVQGGIEDPQNGQQPAWQVTRPQDPPAGPGPAWDATPRPDQPGGVQAGWQVIARQLIARQGRPAGRRAWAAAPDDERLAAIGYLGVPILGFLVPLAVCLLRRRSDSVRQHSIQALNLSLTMLLYGICILIAGVVLALDSAGVALFVVIVTSAALWLAVAGYAIAAALSANQGGFRQIPGWLCATIVR